MKMQTLIDSGDTTTKTTVSQAVIYAVGKEKGPFKGKNGDFYTQSFMVGDGSITGTYERDGQTFDKQAEWVSFYKPKFTLKKGDKISFEMSLNEYNGKFYPQGKRIELITEDTILTVPDEDKNDLTDLLNYCLTSPTEWEQKYLDILSAMRTKGYLRDE